MKLFLELTKNWAGYVAVLKQFLINYCSVHASIVLKALSDTRYNVLYFNMLINNLLMCKIAFKCQISPNLDVLWNYWPMTLTCTFFVAVKLFWCYKRSFNPTLVWITCSLIPVYGWPWNTFLSSYALFSHFLCSIKLTLIVLILSFISRSCILLYLLDWVHLWMYLVHYTSNSVVLLMSYFSFLLKVNFDTCKCHLPGSKAKIANSVGAFIC